MTHSPAGGNFLGNAFHTGGGALYNNLNYRPFEKHILFTCPIIVFVFAFVLVLVQSMIIAVCCPSPSRFVARWAVGGCGIMGDKR